MKFWIWPLVIITVLPVALVIFAKPTKRAGYSWSRPTGEYWNPPNSNSVPGAKLEFPSIWGRDSLLRASFKSREGRWKFIQSHSHELETAVKLAQSTPVKIANPNHSLARPVSRDPDLLNLGNAACWLVLAALNAIENNDITKASLYFDLAVVIIRDIETRLLPPREYFRGQILEITQVMLSQMYWEAFPEDSADVAIRKFLFDFLDNSYANTSNDIIGWGEHNFHWSFQIGMAKRQFEDDYKRSGWPVPSYPIEAASDRIFTLVDELLKVEKEFDDGSFEELVAIAKMNQNQDKITLNKLFPESVARRRVLNQFGTISEFKHKFEAIAILNYLDFLSWIKDHPDQEERWSPNFKQYGYPYGYSYYWSRPIQSPFMHISSEMGIFSFSFYIDGPEPFNNFAPIDMAFPFSHSNQDRLFGSNGIDLSKSGGVRYPGVSRPFERQW